MSDPIVHIVWSPTTGPIAAYRNPEMAHAHSRSMLGVDVGSCPLRSILPTVVRDDIELGDTWDADDDTPVDELAPLSGEIDTGDE